MPKSNRKGSQIYLSPPDVGAEELAKILEAIHSGWVAPVGPFVDALEAEVAAAAGRKWAVALSSGTAALHLGLLSLGVRPGDYVICSTLTFVATANAILYCGAIPIFIDCESNTGNMSATLLEEAIEKLSAEGKFVAAVVPIDFLGAMANYPKIVEVCEPRAIPVLVDAAESVGSSFRGRPSGSFGDVAIFSFNGNKIVTTSGGGALVTDDQRIAERVRHLAGHSREPAPHYQHEEMGFNYRMSNVLASIGVAQFQRLSNLVEARRSNRQKYRNLLSGVEGVSFLGNSDNDDNCWLTGITIEADTAGFTSTDLSSYLNNRNIETRPLWKPMHRQPLYLDELAFLDGSADKLFRLGLALPSGSNLSPQQWARITEAIRGFLG